MVMPRYQRAGIRIAGMPQVSTAGLRASAQANEALARNLDRVANFAFREAGVQAEQEGIEYGALNAPSQQQLEDAIAAGQDPSELVPGKDSTIFGRAARRSALDSMATQFEIEARKEIVEMQSQFEREEIGLADLESGLSSLLSQQSEVLRQVSPQAAQKFTASLGVVTNSAYLSAAKTQAQRDQNDYEIQIRGSMDAIVRNAETIVRAGPTISEDGTVITVNEKINLLRDELGVAAQEVDDPALYQAKLNELNEAVTQAKIGVVMDEALFRPARAMRILYGDGSFEDAEVQATFESMDARERRLLFEEVNTALADKDARDARAEQKIEREAARKSEQLQAQFTAALLADDDELANEILTELEDVDPSAWEQKTEVFNSSPGTDSQDTVIYLRRLSLNGRLTQSQIDTAMTNGDLTLSTYKTFMTDLEQQRNQRYNRAIDWLRAARGVPEGSVLNFNDIQRAADREVAQIKSALLDAIIDDPSIDPYEFVKQEVERLEQEGSAATNVALRNEAFEKAEELRALLKNPNASAAELVQTLQENDDFYPNEQRRNHFIENLAPILIEIEGSMR